MVERLEISGVHMQISEELKKYVVKKIGQLDKFLPSKLRADMHLEVKLKEDNTKGKQSRTCEVILHLPHETLAVKETTVNIFAAVDIVEAKLKTQLKKYKEMHASPRLHQRLLAKIGRS